jgi:hypothetical protein
MAYRAKTGTGAKHVNVFFVVVKFHRLRRFARQRTRRIFGNGANSNLMDAGNKQIGDYNVNTATSGRRCIQKLAGYYFPIDVNIDGIDLVHLSQFETDCIAGNPNGFRIQWPTVIPAVGV